jgi:predicted GNAT family acetyltransferase
MNPDRNTSKSFQVFRDTLREMVTRGLHSLIALVSKRFIPGLSNAVEQRSCAQRSSTAFYQNQVIAA